MRIIGIIIAGCIILTALRLAVTVFALVAIVTLLWALYSKPVQVLCFLVTCAFLRLLETHPILVAGLVTAIVIASRLSRVDSDKTGS